MLLRGTYDAEDWIERDVQISSHGRGDLARPRFEIATKVAKEGYGIVKYTVLRQNRPSLQAIYEIDKRTSQRIYDIHLEEIGVHGTRSREHAIF